MKIAIRKLVSISASGALALASATALANGPTGAATLSFTATGQSTVAKARDLLKKGQTLYSSGNYSDALGAFQAAYQAKPDNSTLFNIAQSHLKLGEYDSAIKYYEQYIGGAKAGSAAAVQGKAALAEAKASKSASMEAAEKMAAEKAAAAEDAKRAEAEKMAAMAAEAKASAKAKAAPVVVNDGGWFGNLASYPHKQPWSALGYQNNVDGHHSLAAEAGWPGLFLTYLYGVTNDFSIGAKVGVNWGPDYIPVPIPTIVGFRVGVDAQLALRYHIITSGRVSFGIMFDPGVLIGFPGGTLGLGTTDISLTTVTLLLPVNFRIGIALTKRFSLLTGLDIPINLRLLTSGYPALLTSRANDVEANIPLLVDLGAELRVIDHMTVFLRVGIGPTVTVSPTYDARGVRDGTTAGIGGVGFNGTVGAMYHF